MSISTVNVRPTSISSTIYASKYEYGNKYGEFKYGAKTYGATSLESAGQAMPRVDTRGI